MVNNKKLSKKKIITLGVLGGVVAIIAVFAILVAKVPSVSTWVTTNALYAIMPHEIESELDAGTLRMGVVKSDKYDKKVVEAHPFAAYEYYYYDLDGNKVDVDCMATFMFGEEEVQPMTVFTFKAIERVNSIKAAAIKVIPFVVIILIVVAIVFWFLNWSKREDEAKNKTHKSQKKNKK